MWVAPRCCLYLSLYLVFSLQSTISLSRAHQSHVPAMFFARRSFLIRTALSAAAQTLDWILSRGIIGLLLASANPQIRDIIQCASHLLLLQVSQSVLNIYSSRDDGNGCFLQSASLSRVRRRACPNVFSGPLSSRVNQYLKALGAAES